MFLRFLLLVLCVAGPLSAAEKKRPAGEPLSRPIELGPTDNGKTLKASMGATIVIRLPKSPSTGYDWRIAAISGGAVQAGSGPAAPRGPAQTGAGGTFVLPLRAVQSGTSTIKLEYVRTWEKDRVPTKTFSVTIEVTAEAKLKPIEVTVADTGKTLKAVVGQTIAISLDGNPTTGFGWQTAAVVGEAVEAVGKPDYAAQAHPAGMVGTGGTFVCRFKAVKPGKATVKLEYVRPWEKDIPPSKTFAATFEVQAP